MRSTQERQPRGKRSLLILPLVALSTFLVSCASTPDAAKKELMVWLEDNGYETPNGTPEIERANIPWDQMYYSKGTVYVSYGWNGSTADKGLLLHELWHHQQNLTLPCMEYEVEAYEVMAAYYKSQGHPMPAGFARQSARASCLTGRLQKK